MFDDPQVERRAPANAGAVRLAYSDLDRSAIPADAKRNRSEQIARMRAAIRQDARLNYGERCGSIELPDDAFNAIEITGDDFPELAVSLGRANCFAGRSNSFSGTGGPVVQIWHMGRDHDGRDGPVRLLLETAMHGFTPGDRRLVVLQHQAFCKSTTAPAFCRNTYVWDEQSRRLDAVERVPNARESREDMQFSDKDLGSARPPQAR